MTPNTFTSDIVQQDDFQVVGLKVKTTMAAAEVDCPGIWEKFGPRMAEITSNSVAYGASVMIDEQFFEYWAALPYNPGDTVPEGMAVLDIPEGLYARCDINGLDELAAAYTHMFQVWSNNSEYGFRCGAPGFELYPKDFYPDMGYLSLYMPLLKLEGSCP